MAQLKVKPSKLKGEIEAQSSKSYTHRALCVGLLASGVSKISKPLKSLDTQATFDAVKILGGKPTDEDGVWRVSGSGGEIKPLGNVIDAKNSGTTIRLMSAIAALSPEPVKLTGDDSILSRPMGPLAQALTDLGARVECEGEDGRPPVTVGGGIKGGNVEITGSVSSQFISALLLACPLAKNPVSITISGKLISKPYILMTLEVMKRAGVKVESSGDLTRFNISSGQVFQSIDYEVPGDFSSAAFVLGAAAITNSTARVKGLDVKDVQGDKRIIDLLKEFGAEVSIGGGAVEVTGVGGLKAISVDCGDIPDLVPILSVLAAVAEGKTSLTNVPHLRFKEVDRLRAIASEVSKLGAKVEEKPDELIIHGVGQLKGGQFKSYGDHRMAMAMVVAGLAAEGNTIVEGAESIPVSYPSFVEDFKKLGANVEVQHSL